MIAGIAPATHGTGYRSHGFLTSRPARRDEQFGVNPRDPCEESP